MSQPVASALPVLPLPIERALKAFIQAADDLLGDDLVSVVLYGSAAEGRLRAMSDVNLLMVLTAFRPEALDDLREPLRLAKAACNLNTMFVQVYEISPLARAFAGKFSDIQHRHVVLLGDDPFATLVIPKEAVISHLQQTLLNLTLRTREAYLLRSLREEQLSPLLVDLVGPLRAAAATLLRLQGQPAHSPKAALAIVAEREGGMYWLSALDQLSALREGEVAPPGVATDMVLNLLTLMERLQLCVDQLA
ncbi:MAG: hypothetical protein H7338_20225 [Candidatus Sericytochromatia bacterium]|nr:hypothetical protein [Candidatus Sericytochromatia bacterium]